MNWDICPDATRVNLGFGPTDYSGEWRRPEVAGGYFHAGIDIGADGIHGKPVYATRPGVIVANQDPSHRITQCAAIGGAVVQEPYLGLHCVCLQADEGVFIEYGHLDSAAVSLGQRVRPGDLLGRVGTNGASCGDHLHLEVRRDGANQGPPWSAVVDPSPWLQGDLSAEEDVLLRQIHNLLRYGTDGRVGACALLSKTDLSRLQLAPTEAAPALVDLIATPLGRALEEHLPAPLDVAAVTKAVLRQLATILPAA